MLRWYCYVSHDQDMNLSCSFKLNFALYFCQIKETLVRELSERFSSEISLLRHEVRVRASSVYVSCHVIQTHAHA